MSVGTPGAVEYMQGRPSADQPFAPIVGTLAASINQVPAESFLSDPTQLANGLQRAQRLFGLDVVCVVPDPALVAEGLGTTVEWDEDVGQFVPVERPDRVANLTDPNDITDAGRVPAVLNAADRLVTSLDDAAVFGVLPGPHTTFEIVFGEGITADDDRMKPIRTATGELARAFGRNGVDGFLIVESSPSDSVDRDGDAVVNPAVEMLELLENIGELFGTVLGIAPGGYARSAIESIVDESAVDAVFLDTNDPGNESGTLEGVRVGGGITQSLLECEDSEIRRTAKTTVDDLPFDAFLASGREVSASVHPRKLQIIQPDAEGANN